MVLYHIIMYIQHKQPLRKYPVRFRIPSENQQLWLIYQIIRIVIIQFEALVCPVSRTDV